jgi:Ca-activated chloride channel family protein
MSTLHMGSPEMLTLLWLLPFLAGVCFYGFRRKDQALRRFAEVPLLRHINASASRSRQWAKRGLVLAAALFLVAALTRPQWSPRPQKVEHKGRDVVVLLDVSRSMLAEDLKPNRLERSKLAIMDLLERLRGDRVALVAFAGTAVVKCPLTQDYGFFRLMLEDIGVDSIERGGTHIGDALRKTLDEVFSDRLKRFKDIVLITDGEDHDSFPVEAAREAGERGIRLLAVGLGDEQEGQRIPIVNEKGERTFLSYGGQEVWTRLDADTLRKMVDATPGGQYLNVATGTFDLGSIYEELVARAEKTQLESLSIQRYEEKFQIFLAAALMLLLLEPWIRERKRSDEKNGTLKTLTER